MEKKQHHFSLATSLGEFLGQSGDSCELVTGQISR